MSTNRRAQLKLLTIQPRHGRLFARSDRGCVGDETIRRFGRRRTLRPHDCDHALAVDPVVARLRSQKQPSTGLGITGQNAGRQMKFPAGVTTQLDVICTAPPPVAGPGNLQLALMLPFGVITMSPPVAP